MTGRFDWCRTGQHVACPGRYHHQWPDPSGRGTYPIHGECGCTCHTRPATLAGESINNRK